MRTGAKTGPQGGLVVRPARPESTERAIMLAITVESHIARIMAKLDLHRSPDEHRRVRTVLAWLRG